MKVELILPRAQPGKLVDVGMYIPSLTMGVLAALTPEDVELRVTDENASDVDYSWEPDLVAISVMTSVAGRAREISETYQAKGAKIVWGGIHPTVVDLDDAPYIDARVKGPAERLWPKLLNDFQGGRLQPLYENDAGVHILMSEVPSPIRDLVKPDVETIIQLVTASRGCAGRCPFCAANQIYGTKISWNSPEKTLVEIARMREFSTAGAFVDDNIMSNREYAHKVLKNVGKFGMKWFAETDPVSSLNEDNVALLANAGVKLVLVGFETVNPENFAGSNKYVPPDQWKTIVDNYHRHGIAVDGNFMIGFDGDNKDVFERTNKIAMASGMDTAAFSILVPYPGTPFHDKIQDRIITSDYSRYHPGQVVFEPKNMTPQELYDGVMEIRQGKTPAMVLVKNLL
jgi:radical SAM superfamily enzyme YgiQ (UPF0313 family)